MADPQDPNQGSSAQPGYDTARPPVDETNPSAPPPPPPGQPVYAAPPQKRGGGLMRFGLSLLLVLLLASVAMNFYFGSVFYALMGGPREAVYQSGDESQRIAILPIEGVIDGETVSFVRRGLSKLKQNEPKAVVLRVESPGGGVTPSDQVWHRLRQFKQKTGVPIVASFGGVAASGGYYVAMPSDHIIAERTSTTGSIGVYAPLFTVGGLLEKIGVTPEWIEAPSSPKKTLGQDVTKAFSEADRQVWRQRLAQAHQQFIDVVTQGRAKDSDELSAEQVKELSQGQTFSADEAKQNHLVDAIGYLDDAIAKAKELGGVPGDVTPRVTRLEPSRSFSLLSLISARERSASLAELDGDKLRSLMHELSQRKLMYLAPFGR